MHIHCLLQPWFNRPNNFCWEAQIMKFLIVQFAPFTSFFLCLVQMFSSALFSNTLSLCSSLRMRETRFHSHIKQQVKLYSVCFSLYNLGYEKKRNCSELSEKRHSPELKCSYFFCKCPFGFLLLPHLDLLTVIILWFCHAQLPYWVC